MSADGQDLSVWDIGTGKELHHLAAGVGRPTGEPLAASPTGRVLAVGMHRQWTNGGRFHETGAISLWDLISGERIRQFDVPQGTVTSLAFTPDGRTLASGGWDSTIVMWDVTSRPRKNGLKHITLAERELDDLWSALAGDAGTAEEALWSFVRVPEQAIAYLQGRLRFSKRALGEQTAKLIADLDNEQFRVRQQAIKGLDELGEAAEGAAHKALEGNPTLEARRRLESFLEKRKKEVFRKLRAVEVLEQVGTPDAPNLLQALMQEASNPRVVEAASAALQRLRTRRSIKP